MAPVRKIDSDFLTKFTWAADIRAAGGFAQFEDRKLQYVVMLDSVRMRVIHRTAKELFETTVENDVKREPGLAITGCFMDNMTLRGIDTRLTTSLTDKSPVRPDLQDFAGVVIEKGRKISGSASEPEYAHLSFKEGPPSQILIGRGDPDPATGITEAYGALGATILGRTALPTPNNDPAFAGVDRRFNDLRAEGHDCGLPYVAISKKAKIIVAAVKPHGESVPMFEVRNRFFDAGFDDVVFLDGGDSAYLHLNGTWIVRMGPYKTRITTFGTKFFYATPP